MHSTIPSTLGILNFEPLFTLQLNVENVQFDLKFSYFKDIYMKTYSFQKFQIFLVILNAPYC